MAYSLEKKLQAAFINLLSSNSDLLAGIGLDNFHHGNGNDTLTLPCVTVHTVRGKEMCLGTGTFEMFTDITLRVQADDVTDTDEELDLPWAQVASVCESDTLADQLSNSGEEGIRVYGLRARSAQTAVIVDRHWERTYQVDLWAVLTDAIHSSSSSSQSSVNSSSSSTSSQSSSSS